jgi:hypothetical protein
MRGSVFIGSHDGEDADGLGWIRRIFGTSPHIGGAIVEFDEILFVVMFDVDKSCSP